MQSNDQEDNWCNIALSGIIFSNLPSVFKMPKTIKLVDKLF